MDTYPDRAIPELISPFDEPAFCCEVAEWFAAWVDKLIDRITGAGSKQPTYEQVEKAKALLVDEFRKERRGAEREHRDRLTDPAGDPCIYGVFVAGVERIAS